MLYRETQWRRATILVVEDVPAIRKMVCAMLGQAGYDCLEACDGREALNLLEDAEHVQLVLTDVVMPNMNGPELARHLCEKRPELRILFMSGYTEDSTVHSLGFFLAKPFTAMALTEKVRQALDRPWEGVPDTRPYLKSA